MKKFAKLFVVALAIALVASLFALSASAVPATDEIPNPANLKPGSDKVIFIKDAPRDEDNKIIGDLEGDGTGTDAANPLQPSDTHDKFDSTAERKRWHLLTAFYQAVEMLMNDGGGTIVICGPVHIGIDEVSDNGSSNVRDMVTEIFGNKVIKFTSVYNGVDYRETAGAKLTIKTPAMLDIKGSTIWENIDIETDGKERAICFGEYRTLIGEGVKCYPSDEAYEGVATEYISLAAGSRHNGCQNRNPSLLVQSGTYNKITAGAWGTIATQLMNNSNTYLTIEGTTTVLGSISGTVNSTAQFKGNVNITINSGTFFECDINGVGSTGMVNTDGIVNIKINGGDFKNAWSISQAPMGSSNNLPAVCTLDFSGWTGDKLSLAYADALVTDITDIKYPEGVTKADLTAALADAPKDTEPPATEPAKPEDTSKPEESETKKQDDVTKVPETKEPTTSTEPGDDEGSDLGLIIGIVAAVVVIAAVVVVIVMKKKKAAK